MSIAIDSCGFAVACILMVDIYIWVSYVIRSISMYSFYVDFATDFIISGL